MSHPQIWPRIACIAHAAVGTLLWYLRIMMDNEVLPARAWTVTILLWLPWLVVPLLVRKERRAGWLWTIVISLAVLSPTYSTLYSFAIWSIGGFAP